MNRTGKILVSPGKRAHAVTNAQILAACLLIVYVHLAYINRDKFSQTTFEEVPTSGTTKLTHGALQLHSSTSPVDLPDVIIYRRTKKTGSSSMLEQILKVTNQLGYVPFYDGSRRMWDLVYTAVLHNKPSRFIISEHNSVTRDDLRGKKAVIIDTVIDGYRQMTSHCRFVYKVKNCDDELIKCLRTSRKENFYRWAGRNREDLATYIDLPLSSAHPALSTAIMQRVFPNAILDVRHLNSAQSACAEDPKIRKVYNETYHELEQQIAVLRSRMLTLAGYPSRIHGNVSIEETVDRAEELEKERQWRVNGYKFGTYERSARLSKEHSDIKYQQPTWVRRNGQVVIERK